MPKLPAVTSPERPEIEDRITVVERQTAEAVLVLDLDGVIHGFNQAAADLFGPDLAGQQSAQFAERTDLHFRNGKGVNLGQLTSRQPINGEAPEDEYFFFNSRDGEEMVALLSASPLFAQGDQATSAVIVFRDITGVERFNVENGSQQTLVERNQVLAESHWWIAEILESIEDGFFAIDRQWQFTYVNERAAKTGDMTQDELIGQVIWEKWPQLIGTTLEQYYRQAMEERVPVSFEVEGLLTRAWYFVRVYPTFEGISVFWIDITKRREMEQHLAYHSLLLETIHDAVMATDVDERITAWNRAAEELSGWRTDEVLGRKIGEVIRTGSQTLEQNELTWRPLQEGKPVVLEVPIYRKDGRQILVSTTTMPIFDPGGHLIGYVSAGRDVTEQKQAEDALQQAYNELEGRVQERTQELTELQWRLIESIEAERLRVSRELHDGPMQDLYGLIYQASLLEDSPSTTERQAEVTTILQRLKEVNESLRTIAYDLRPVSLTQLGLEKAIREYTTRLQIEYPQLEMDLTLQPDENILPESHRLALFRVCQVGLNNVVRHAQASRVEVRLECGRELVVLEIQDNGRGFEVPKHLLSLARRGHLGLVGAAERVEALGGKLEVHSTIGQGTSIRVRVPVRERIDSSRL